MSEHILIGLASILVFGIGAQWLAWRLKLPSILLLLLCGFLVGPVGGIIDPDALLGELLLPVVSVSVALILFEGGLSLRLSDLKGFGAVVTGLVTVGVLVTWVVATAGAHYLLGFELSLALLIGAVLVVTGPTVIIPLLRHVRPSAPLGSILKWEGIVVDPIGAMLAVLVFEGIVAGGMREATSLALMGIAKTLLIGGVTGSLGALVMVSLLRRYWIPDFLQNPVTLMLVVSTFTLSNHFQAESGLLAVTIMGIVLANQSIVTVKHIVEFKENLRVLLISALFIVLAARLRPADLSYLRIEVLIFLALLILVARPISVYLSTLGSGLSLNERLFLMSMAPRGIVAAAIASVFALRLSEKGFAGAEMIVPITFFVIIGTVAVYGLGAAPVAAALGVARAEPQGVLIVGCQRWARSLASVLKGEGFDVLLVDSNRLNVSQARMDGLPVFHGSILSEHFAMEADLGGIGKLLAMTYNDNVNSLACVHFTDVFGRGEVYQLHPEDEKTVSQELRGRLLFGDVATYVDISKRFRRGGAIKATGLTEAFDYGAFSTRYKHALPFFLIDEKKGLMVFSADSDLKPRPGQTIISLVGAGEEVEANTDKGEGEGPETGKAEEDE